MATTTVTDAGSVRIITEVIPATDPRAAQLASGSQAPARTSFQTQGFRRAHPKVLGVRHGLSGVPAGIGDLWGLSCWRFSLAGWRGNWDRCLSRFLPGTLMWDLGGMCLTAMGSGFLSLILPQTIHIFSGIIHISFGIILTLWEHRNPSLPVASGILFWLGTLVSWDEDMGISGSPGGLGTISQGHQVSTDTPLPHSGVSVHP